MGVRFDSCHVKISMFVEFEGHTDVEFDLHPDHPLVPQLIQANLDQLTAQIALSGEKADPTIMM